MGSSEGAERQAGFTLVELLVVIVIIAILAAIAIPIFFNQREKGLRAQVESGLKNAATIMQGWATENDGDYEPDPPGGNALGNQVGDMAFLKAQDWRAASAVTVDIVEADENGFCIAGVHDDNPSVQLEYSSYAGAPVEGNCI